MIRSATHYNEVVGAKIRLVIRPRGRLAYIIDGEDFPILVSPSVFRRAMVDYLWGMPPERTTDIVVTLCLFIVKQVGYRDLKEALGGLFDF